MNAHGRMTAAGCVITVSQAQRTVLYIRDDWYAACKNDVTFGYSVVTTMTMDTCSALRPLDTVPRLSILAEEVRKV